MSGVQRNKRSKLKRFGETPKRKVMSDAERAERLKELKQKRKVTGLMDRIMRAAQEVVAITSTSTPLTLLVARDFFDISIYIDDITFSAHNLYRIPHHPTGGILEPRESGSQQ